MTKLYHLFCQLGLHHWGHYHVEELPWGKYRVFQVWSRTCTRCGHYRQSTIAIRNYRGRVRSLN